MKDYLEAGQIVNTHGIHGEVRVMPWADSPEFLLNFKTVYLDGKPAAVRSARVQKSCVLLLLEGIETVEAASALREKIITIRREDAHLEEGALFVQDIEGMTVTDQNGNTLGKVTEVISMPRNDVYLVKGNGEYMIPAVPEYVKSMNAEAGTMEVFVIEGMRTDAD